MKYNGAEILVKLLEKQGVEYIAGIPGGFNLPIYDALYNSNIKHILSRHEQGAGFIAQGISRSSNKIGVCLATSGPGATNLLTAIADAKLDSIPMIAITGQVPYSAIGTDAFQEVDAYGLTIPITKHNFIIRKIEDIFYVVPEAFKIATEGRPGPVLIDFPKNIQSEVIEFKKFPSIEENKVDIDIPNTHALSYIGTQINKAKRPIIYAGGGIISSNSSKYLYDLAKKNNIPVALTLMGLGAFSADDELYLGMLGMHGCPFTNLLINEADLILAFGVRFDDRATGDIKKFCPKASIIHVDIDESEINKVKNSSISMNCSINSFLKAIIGYIDENPRTSWIQRINCFKNKYPLPSYDDPMHPANIISFVADKIPDDSIIVTDVGQHQMWTAQRYPFKYPKTLLTSGGLGTMGFSLPAAIGASLYNPQKLIISFSGDGSILMNIQELATLAETKSNIKLLIINNHHLGLVRQQQNLFYHKHYIASEFIFNPNFKTIAEGFGIKGYDLSNESDPLEKLTALLTEIGPAVINIPINDDENIYPMVPPGAANTEMIGGIPIND